MSKVDVGVFSSGVPRGITVVTYRTKFRTPQCEGCKDMVRVEAPVSKPVLQGYEEFFPDSKPRFYCKWGKEQRRLIKSSKELDCRLITHPDSRGKHDQDSNL